jgi:hypothetical protein
VEAAMESVWYAGWPLRSFYIVAEVTTRSVLYPRLLSHVGYVRTIKPLVAL